MVNGLIISKFDEQRNFIENIFNKYYNKCINSIQNLNGLNKGIKDVSKIKNIHTIQNEESVLSVCILKDKRLVSGDLNGSIEVYNTSYQSQFHIKNAHDERILSLCV